MIVDESGVTWNIRLPLKDNGASRLLAGQAADKRVASSKYQASPSSAKLSGKRILVIEDETLLALDTLMTLEDAGAEVADAAATCKAALEQIGLRDFDAAVLDGNLGGEPVDAVAAALARRSIPFVFVTGYGRESLPHSFAHAPLLTKPFSGVQLVDVIIDLISTPSSVAQIRPRDRR